MYLKCNWYVSIHCSYPHWCSKCPIFGSIFLLVLRHFDMTLLWGFFCLFCFLFFVCLGHATWLAGISVPWPGTEPGPWQQNPGILTARPQGNSQPRCFLIAPLLSGMFAAIDNGQVESRWLGEKSTRLTGGYGEFSVSSREVQTQE